MTDGLPDEVQRWTAKRRSALIVSILKGETAMQEAARNHGLTLAEIEDWREKFLLGAENALRTKPKDEEALKDEQIKRLKQKVGELVLDIDILKEGREGAPFRPGDVRRVRAMIPQASERRVCRLLQVPRSAMTGTMLAPGSYDLPDGTVEAVGTLEWADLEGGFWTIGDSTKASGDAGRTVAVITNATKDDPQYVALAGAAVRVLGNRTTGASVSATGLEIEATSISEVDETASPSE